jgi:hypothetical protein
LPLVTWQMIGSQSSRSPGCSVIRSPARSITPIRGGPEQRPDERGRKSPLQCRHYSAGDANDRARRLTDPHGRRRARPAFCRCARTHRQICQCRRRHRQKRHADLSPARSLSTTRRCAGSPAPRSAWRGSSAGHRQPADMPALLPNTVAVSERGGLKFRAPRRLPRGPPPVPRGPGPQPRGRGPLRELACGVQRRVVKCDLRVRTGSAKKAPMIGIRFFGRKLLKRLVGAGGLEPSTR